MPSKDVHNFIRKENEIDDMVSMIDRIMESGTSRLKIKTSDAIKEGTVEKVSHHGRCDIGSAFACGIPFDVLEEQEGDKK